MTGNSTFDYILVGGGLQSSLMAAAIAHHQPAARVALIERESQLAGNHTWSFHETDLPPSCQAWFEPFIEKRWPAYDVIVGGRQRTIHIGYLSMTSGHVAQALRAAAQRHPISIRTGATAVEVTPRAVCLEDGQRLESPVVWDNRGPARIDEDSHAGGFQKFWGFEVELACDWPAELPVIMDDRFDQSDGFRFLYTLPFDRRRVLVEDTRFSNSSAIDRDECLATLRAHLQRMGCEGWTIRREEQGVLPMPTRGSPPGNTLPHLAGGYRGGWFHAATGYSFPLAIQLANLVATAPPELLAESLVDLKAWHAGRATFARFLNRLLFDLVAPEKRYQIFRRFYRVLSEPRIARFYGHRFTAVDAFRIVVGIPPGGLRPLNFLRSLSPPPRSRLRQNTSASTGRLLT